MTQFGMSRHGLVQLFRRVGVTEFEARYGTLPQPRSVGTVSSRHQG